MLPIEGLDPNLEWLVKYEPFVRPDYDSRIFILRQVEEVTTEPHPVYPDLKLEQYDLKHVYPELQFCMPFKDGSSLCIHSDVERTVKSIEKFSKKDAKAYQELFKKSKEFVENIIAPGTYVQPSPALESVVKMQQTELGRELMEFSEKTPLSVVDELFEHEKVKALMLYILCMWGLDMQT